MAIQIRVSRQGLTSCPSCSRHIRVDREDWKNTVCPFCDISLADSVRQACEGKNCAAEKPSSVLDALRAMVGARGGAVAASLLSLGILSAGCSEDQTAVPLYGIPPPTDSGTHDDAATADTGATVADSGDPGPVPLYGISPSDGGSSIADAGPADAGPADPDSGAHADASADPDAGSGTLDAGGDTDASGERDSGVVDAEDPGPVPLYGISPQDAG